MNNALPPIVNDTGTTPPPLNLTLHTLLASVWSEGERTNDINVATPIIQKALTALLKQPAKYTKIDILRPDNHTWSDDAYWHIVKIQTTTKSKDTLKHLHENPLLPVTMNTLIVLCPFPDIAALPIPRHVIIDYMITNANTDEPMSAFRVQPQGRPYTWDRIVNLNVQQAIAIAMYTA